MSQYRYYLYEGMPCRVEQNESGLRAEGYFRAQGFLPVSVTAVTWHGEGLSEKAFKSLIISIRRGQA